MANLTDIRSNWSTGASEGGVTVYATKENLPATGLTSGDQAYVTNTSRLYISNGSGWYNVALINATPSLTIDPTGAIELSKEGASTVITLTGTDSDNAVDGLTFSVDSDGSFGGLATISQDSSVFTITPLSADSATTTTSTLTFKASDGISFGSGQRTLSLAFAIVNSNYTTLLLQNEETSDNQVDASTNAYTITENGNVTSTAFTPHHPGGYSVLYDGNSDFLSVSADTSLDLGTGDFTMEAWVHPKETGNSYPSFMSSVTGWSSGASGHRFDNTGHSGKFGFYVNGFGGRSSGNPFMYSTNTFTHNNWYHYAITRSGNTFKMYINGVLEDTQTDSGSLNAALGGFKSGGSFDGANGYFAGYVKDIRIVKGSVVYTEAFTPPIRPLTAIANTSLLACHLPYIADGSTNGHTITVAGTTSTKRVGPYDYTGYAKADYGGSVYFDGTGDWLTISNSSEQMMPEAGDFTIEFWFYTPNASTRQDPYSSYAHPDGWAVALSLTTAGDITPYYGNATPNQTAGGQFKANVWNHFAMAKSGTTLKMFMNGKTILTDTNDTRDYSGTSDLYIGAAGNQTFAYTGWISDARFVKGTAVYTSDFTPPTQPLTAITNTQLLTCTNKNDIWDAGSGALLTKAGNVTGGANSGDLKFGKTAVYFDGTGDHLIYDLGRNIGTSDFTIEGWVWANENLHKGIWQISNNTAGLDTNHTIALALLFQPGYGWQIYGRGGAHNSSGPTAITLSQWYHFAYVKTAGASKLYIDGVEVITGSDTVNYAVRYLAIGGSYSTGYLWNGYIQDMRISLDHARYTSTFTPPTQEFDG